ncbi:MAG: hypothetical protein CMF49_02855 [Legionellales bacterium]|nr:hypothetical protein [Legionellales bacterium]
MLTQPSNKKSNDYCKALAQNDILRDTYLLFISKNTDKSDISALLEEVNKYGFELNHMFTDAIALSQHNTPLTDSIRYWRQNTLMKTHHQFNCWLLLDLNPIPLTKVQASLFPKIDNGRILYLASAIRKKLTQINAKNISCFTSISNHVTQKILAEAPFSSTLLQVNHTVEGKRAAFTTPYIPLFSIYQYSFSAKIELIYCNDRPYVLKTFRPSCKKHLQNELIAYQNLAKIIPEIPKLFDYGENYLVIPYYPAQKVFNFSGLALLDINKAKKMFDILRKFYDAGYALIDSHPKNFLYDIDNNIKIIDFEYLFKYQEKPKSYHQSIDIQGYEDKFLGLAPADHAHYITRWQPYIGLSYNDLTNGNHFAQQIKRGLFWFINRFPKYCLRVTYKQYKYYVSLTLKLLYKLKLNPPTIKMKP